MNAMPLGAVAGAELPPGVVAAPQAMPAAKADRGSAEAGMMSVPVLAPAGIGRAKSTFVPSVGVVALSKNCSQVTAATALTTARP